MTEVEFIKSMSIDYSLPPTKLIRPRPVQRMLLDMWHEGRFGINSTSYENSIAGQVCGVVDRALRESHFYNSDSRERVIIRFRHPAWSDRYSINHLSTRMRGDYIVVAACGSTEVYGRDNFRLYRPTPNGGVVCNECRVLIPELRIQGHVIEEPL